MKQKFIDWNPTEASIERLLDIIKVLDEYAELGFRLTLRQLYYQLVSKNIIENEPTEYSKLGDLLSKARLAGMVDWDAIEDRVRQPKKHAEWDSVQDLVDSATEQYRLPRWSDQEFYVELWCEKDALASVIEPLTDEYHITLMINRGYSSWSAMYDASQRMHQAIGLDQKPIIFYLGDFDPSGEDMVRDIGDRLETLDVPKGHENDGVIVDKIALTHKQVNKYKPPRNPAKLTDSRARDFVRRYGEWSYEVDAIHPLELQKIVRKAIESVADLDALQEWKDREEVEKEELTKLSKKIK